MNAPIKTSFLGTGWGFPVTFLRDGGSAANEGNPDEFAVAIAKSGGERLKIASEIELIEQSLTILLNTRPGERVMRPDYGCALDDVMFEPANTSLLTYIKDIISKSILYYEPRVQLRGIEIKANGLVEDGHVLVELDLIVRTTNSRYNYVYDFYQKEATIQPI